MIKYSVIQCLMQILCGKIGKQSFWRLRIFTHQKEQKKVRSEYAPLITENIKLEIHACSDPSPRRKVLFSATGRRQLQATEIN